MPIRGFAPWDIATAFVLDSGGHELLNKFVGHVCGRLKGTEGKDFKKKELNNDRVEITVSCPDFYNEFTYLHPLYRRNFQCLFRGLWEGWEKVDVEAYQGMRELRVTLIR